MQHDWTPPRNAQAPRPAPRRRLLLRGALAALLLTVAGLLLFGRGPSPAALDVTIPATLAAPPPEVQREVRSGTVQPGESLSALLGALVSPQEMAELARRSRDVFPLSRICAGQPYQVCTVDGALERFVYDIDREEVLVIEPGEEGLTLRRDPIPYTIKTVTLAGTITSSLFAAVDALGEGPEVALGLADIFAWDIDFLRDVRVGDTFRAIVQKRFRDGQPAGYGRILAAEFVNQGETFRALRFADGDRPASYYDPAGNNLRKAFLKAPLSYSRISSGFSMRRFHPVTQTWKAHPAVDYAAPTGTPIMAVGDGVISKLDHNRNNGNYIKIRHNSTYETLYLHMSRFAKGMKTGRRVSQGEVIGYVGSTGLATGPHLCFRMYANGAPVNPFRLKIPAAKAVSPENLASFKAETEPLLAQLDTVEVRVAQAAAHDSGNRTP